MYVSLLAASKDCCLDRLERNTVIKLTHIKTFSSDPILTDYYAAVDRDFEKNVAEINEQLPKEKQAREFAIRKELRKLDGILRKLDAADQRHNGLSLIVEDAVSFSGFLSILTAMFRWILTIFLISLSFIQADAQKESANWYFGQQGLGLSFVNNNLPQDITGIPSIGLSPSTVVSDAAGNLQFIFAAGRVYDRNYGVMPGSSLLQMGISWNQVMAAPAPSSNSRYYLFYMSGANAGLYTLRYAIVDMSLNGGLGDVVSADNIIDDQLSPAFTLVNRSGSDEFWVVGHKMGTINWACRLVTAAGISSSPVTSVAGTNPNLYEYNFQDMKTSPNGKMIAGIGYYLDTSSWFWEDYVFLEVFNFDSQTGAITNKIRTIPTGYIYQNVNYCSFSPDNRLVYANFGMIAYGLQPCGYASNTLFQYNLCYDNIDSFTLYAPVVGNTLTFCAYPYWGKLQIGMDKKIHMPYAGTYTLSAVDFPNRIGTSSKTNFPEYTLPKAADGGLPDFYHYYIYKGAGNNILYNGGCYPQPTHFKITNDALPNIQWDFGDPASGGANTAGTPTADHVFSAPGLYTVTAKVLSPTGSLQETLTELVEIKDPAKRLLSGYPKDTVLCGGGSALVKLSVVNGIFSWHFRDSVTGNYFKAGIADSMYVGGLGTGTYYVQMRQNDCDGCHLEDSIHVTVLPKPSFSLGYDTYVCTGDSLLLTVYASGADIIWSTGDNTPSIYVKQPGTYWAKAEYDHNGCPKSDTIVITQQQGVSFSLPGDTTLCNDETLLLDPGVQQATYTWQDYSSASSFQVKDPGKYWVRISNSYCSKADTINVSYVNAAGVYLGTDTILCVGDSLRLQPTLPGGTYLWSTGAADPAITVKTSGDYWLKVDNGVCTVSDTIQAVFNPRPAIGLGNDTIICQGQTLVLRGGVTQGSFRWQDGSAADTLTVNAPGEYWLQETVNGCTVRDTMEVSYKPLPVIYLGKDTTLCAGQQLILDAWGPSIQSWQWQDQSIQDTYTVTTQGAYWAKVTGNNGCVSADTINISIQPLPVFTLGPDTVLCIGQQLNYNFGLPGAGYLWNTGSQTGQQAIGTAGKYWLMVTQQGCSSTDTVTLAYKPLPIIDLGKDTSLCEGQTKLLTPGPASYSYTWQDNSPEDSYLVDKAGLYFVTATLNGCDRKDSIRINYLYKPAFSLGKDSMLCKGLMILLNPGISDASFLWQDGSTGSTLKVTEAGLYKLTATNQCGSHSEAITIVEGTCSVMLPNAFTPNNDGHNDVFRLKYPEIVKTFRLVIFNRWGQPVFETTDPYKGWDGRVKGEDALTGNYVWVMTYTDMYGYKGSDKGTVILVR